MLSQVRNVLKGSAIVKSLLSTNKMSAPKPLIKVYRFMASLPYKRTAIMPVNPLFENPPMYSFEVLSKHLEAVPIIVITLIGFSCEVAYTIRQAFTRDDVRYGKKMLCEVYNLNRPPPIRKFRVYNQQYKWPQGLIEACTPMTVEELQQKEKEEKEKKRLEKEQKEKEAKGKK